MKPVLVGFLCQWCAAKALENLAHRRLKLPEGFLPVRINCTGALELAWITEALYRGATGVLIGGCPRGQCHFREGNTRASLRITAYRKLLAAMEISRDRVRTIWVGSGEGERLYREIWRLWRELTGEGSSL
ncbi:hydrogenase iron-sulfur subunit [Thermosulfurimonas sp. F29]|uniref:hydrogenase iron-sulfur subunit n=1 Tax=Thermosulfurimonas sp. F29 TaxID=2867247 RepID=UPI001C83B944|nr:hydrogenase iron-sulfur subunit [Thermosulfurimonas sp. F29]MBX6424031.1 hydrogenase iron-sulfur subunit [Thermosulfurimonas sp. F29]